MQIDADRCELYGTIVGTMMSPLLAPFSRLDLPLDTARLRCDLHRRYAMTSPEASHDSCRSAHDGIVSPQV